MVAPGFADMVPARFTEAPDTGPAWDDSDLGDGPGAGEVVTLSEAERLAGVSRSALRAWYRNGEIPSRLEPGPHGPQRVVPLDAVLERANRGGRLGRRLAEEASVAASAPLAPDPIGALTTLVDRLTADLRARADAAEARAGAAEAELRRALERAATAEGRAGAAEAELRRVRP